MNRTARIAFINQLSPFPKKLLANLYSVIKGNKALEGSVLAEGYEQALNEQKQAMAIMNLDRFAFIQNLKEKRGYNPSELVSSIKKAVSKIGSQDQSKKWRASLFAKNKPPDFDEEEAFNTLMENHILAGELLTCLDLIGTPEAYKTLYECLIDNQIDGAVRSKAITGLTQIGTSKALQVLKDIKKEKELERDKSYPDKPYLSPHSHLIAMANEAIEIMQKREF